MDIVKQLIENGKIPVEMDREDIVVNAFGNNLNGEIDDFETFVRVIEANVMERMILNGKLQLLRSYSWEISFDEQTKLYTLRTVVGFEKQFQSPQLEVAIEVAYNWLVKWIGKDE